MFVQPLSAGNDRALDIVYLVVDASNTIPFRINLLDSCFPYLWFLRKGCFGFRVRSFYTPATRDGYLSCCALFNRHAQVLHSLAEFFPFEAFVLSPAKTAFGFEENEQRFLVAVKLVTYLM